MTVDENAGLSLSEADALQPDSKWKETKEIDGGQRWVNHRHADFLSDGDG
jgi:hypothetical protein